MKKLWKKCGLFILAIGVIVLFLLAFFINHYPFFYNYIHSTPQCDATAEINAWFSFLSGCATAILAAIAWFKFSGFYDQNQTNILLNVDDRWGSPESITARVLIHELYLQVRKENEEFLAGECRECQDKLIQNKLGQKINEMSMEFGREKDFIHLLNFLDFMETIGYIEDKDHVTHKELDALCGESLIFNYKIFT